MNINVSRRQTIGGLAVAALLAGLVAVGLSNPLPADAPPAPKAEDFSPYVTKEGGISLPADYREKFVHLGTYAVATKPDKPVDEMHNVYARPEDVQAYRRDGKFPDGAILVKDVTTVGSEELTTGQSTWTKDIKIWFVMVKDSKAVPEKRPVGRRLGLGPVRGEGAEEKRGDGLQDRLQVVSRASQEGRLGVHPRIPGPREAHPARARRV